MTRLLQQKVNMDLDNLNKEFAPLAFDQRIERLYQYFEEEEVLFTSSFGTSAVFLLHLFSRLHAQQPVYFINTGYHFPETLKYKEELIQLLQLRVISVHPNPIANQRTQHTKLWTIDSNKCCYINKVLPLEALKEVHQVWVSGLLGFQNGFRKVKNVFERQGNLLKFYPLIDVSETDFNNYLKSYQLPIHPLVQQGYHSIGCTHCTLKGLGRTGRWKGSNKTECGLHLNRFNN